MEGRNLPAEQVRASWLHFAWTLFPHRLRIQLMKPYFSKSSYQSTICPQAFPTGLRAANEGRMIDHLRLELGNTARVIGNTGLEGGSVALLLHRAAPRNLGSPVPGIGIRLLPGIRIRLPAVRDRKLRRTPSTTECGRRHRHSPTFNPCFHCGPAHPSRCQSIKKSNPSDASV